MIIFLFTLYEIVLHFMLIIPYFCFAYPIYFLFPDLLFFSLITHFELTAELISPYPILCLTFYNFLLGA